MIGSRKRRPSWSRSHRATIFLSRNVAAQSVIAGPARSTELCSKSAPLPTRAIDERPKPNGERIPMFRDSAKESLELDLFSTSPGYDDYEILRLTDSLTDFAEKFGPNDPIVKQVLAGKSPRARAVELVTGTKLKDVDFRKNLYAKHHA